MNGKTIDLYGWIACGLLTLVVIGVGFWPMVERRAESQQQRQVLTEKQAEAQKLGLTLATMRERLTSVENAAADESLELQGVERLNHRLGRLTALASASGLEIERVVPGESVPGKHYEKVPITMSGRGSFASARAFLHALHGELLDVSVAGMTLSTPPGTDTEADSEPTFAFQLQWYASPRHANQRVGP